MNDDISLASIGNSINPMSSISTASLFESNMSSMTKDAFLVPSVPLINDIQGKRVDSAKRIISLAELLFSDYDTDPLLLISVKRNRREMKQLRSKITHRQQMRREKKLKRPNAVLLSNPANVS